MIAIEALFFGHLRDITGTRRHLVNLPEDSCTLGDLTALLVTEFGERLGVSIEQTAALRILIDGQEYTHLGGQEAQLKSGCIVAYLPPIFGG